MEFLMSQYFPVLGLEVHAQLTTDTKLFCSCELDFGGEPNTRVCPTCLGMPGTLPVPNAKAVDLAIRLGLALNCEIDYEPMWTRKNYFYPDLPKGYQITQTGGIPIYDHPICKNGHLEITLADGTTKRIGITRIHMEEDAGKLVHDFSPKNSHFDANRCGTPLCEIVSEPDIRSAEEAVLYLEKLKQILEYTGVCDANMEKGNMRCDANISLRPSEDAPYGTRCEIKNLNSFSNLQKAVDAEIALQTITLNSGGTVDQCTKRYDVNANKTIVIRSKEDAHDYRYFPEPDMVRLRVTDAMIQAQRELLPELPDARRARYVAEFGVTAYDAHVLTLDREVADYFEAAVAGASNAKGIANWIISEVLREVKDLEGGLSAVLIQPTQMAELVALIDAGTISGKIAKTVFAEMWTSGKSPKIIVEEKGLVQVSDSGAIKAIVEQVMEENPSQVADILAGKDKLKGFIVGNVMRKSQGKANPAMVNQLLEECLAARRS